MKILATLLLLSLGLAGRAQTLPQVATPPPPDASLEFVANQGQWPASIRYGAAVPGGHLYLENSALRYVLYRVPPHPHYHDEAAHAAATAAGRAATPPGSADAVPGHQLWVHFEGAQPAPALATAQPTDNRRNYLVGNDPAHWAQGVAGYRQVSYQQPWPGIDVRLYENATQHLEYDFELAAGASPDLVQLRYDGATSLSVSEDGQLHVGTSVGALTELRPHAYQLDPATGAHQPVACAYQLIPNTATVSFALGDYDHGRPLVIDPTVLFSTYSGALGDNWGFTATYDNDGNLYSGGIVLADGVLPSYPTTGGAFQTTFGGVVDIALIKYMPTANGPAARVWATYLGGNAADFPSSLVVNAQNELVVLGSTASTNYPVSRNAVQRSFRGGTAVAPFGGSATTPPAGVPTGTDIVVTRLSASGGGLAASTYLGGSGNDGIAAYVPTSSARQLPQNYGDALRGDVLVDAQGNIYVASVTASPDFPTTTGSFGASYRGGTCDAVVCKLSADLSTLLWSGLLGGPGADAAYSLQLDPAGNVYAAGGTLSTALPGTLGGAGGSYQASSQGNVDGFVARIAADGRSILRTTFLGTSSYDQAFFVQLGADGGVYVLGQSLGTWPVSAGTYRNAGSHQYISKLSADLSSLQVSTVFGSGSSTIDISPTAFLVDQCDRIYVCGWGGAINQYPYNYTGYVPQNGYTHGLPTTANAVRTTPDTPGRGSDFYLAQFSAGLRSLDYATFYGNAAAYSEGDHVDGGTSRFDPRGVVYAAVCSCGSTTGFPIPPGAYAYSPTNNSGSIGSQVRCNNAAFKINFEPTSATVGSDQTVCANARPVPLSGLPAGGTWTGPGVSGSVATGFVFTPSVALAGAQRLTYTVPGVSTVCTASAQLTITVTVPVTATAAALGAVCLGAGPVALTSGQPAGGTWSGPGVSGSVATGFVFTPSAALVGTQRLTYAVAAVNACNTASSQVTVTIQVLNAPVVVLPADTVLCPGSRVPFRLRAQPAGGTWTGPGVSGSVAAGFVFTPPAAPGTVTLGYSASGGGAGCVSAGSRRITLLAAPVLAASLVPGPCTPSTVAPYEVHYHLDAAGLPAGAAISWYFGDDSTAVTGPDAAHVYRTAGTYRPRVVVSFNQGQCSQRLALAPLTVQEMLVPNIITPGSHTLNAQFRPRLGGCPPHLQIFSRWGRLVYDDPAYQGTWDGNELAAGLYYYLLTPTTAGMAPLKGWVEMVK